MMRALALLVGRHAARVIAPIRPEQAAAMYAELEHVEGGWPAMKWACGCLTAAYRQRASVVAIAVVGARLGVALAAGLFGLMHLVVAITAAWFKLQAIAGADLRVLGQWWTRSVQESSVEQIALLCCVLGVIGAVHVVAAVMLALGRNDRVCRYAIALIVMEVAFGALRLPGMTLPTIYVVLALMMALASSGLFWLWAWDERRMARG